MATPTPSQTLYIRNLHERINIKTLISSLKVIFEPFGTILDLKCDRHFKSRGQAFIVFDSIQAATNALQSVHGFPLFNKPMDINFARNKSDYLETDKDQLELVQAKRRERVDKPMGKRQKTETIVIQQDQYLFPNTILFVQNLPPTSSQFKLEQMFGVYQGFKEVRVVPGKSELAFVEFDNEANSTIAKDALNRYRVDQEHTIRVSYAKK